ncbi:MAG: prephenate dehydratase [Candidatus Bathyarchaeia archaeon]
MEGLEDYRIRIDELDEKILEYLALRVEAARKIGEYKRSHGIPVRDREREAQVLSRIRFSAEKYGLDPLEVSDIYRLIQALCRHVQGEEPQVAYLGPRGTFSEEAARKYFTGEPAVYTPLDNVKDIFRLVSTGEVDYGVVPVENSIEGSVNIVLDMLLEMDCMVYGEVEVRIRHNLLAKPDMGFHDVRMVLSHPQALAQCRPFLEENLPKARIVESASTSAAVKRASRLKGAAAIGTELAAQIYEMNILARGIESNPNNFTRFLIISRDDHHPSGRDKTSIIFSVPHKPGALHRALQPLASRNINLTRIESRPARMTPWDYLFYCDFEGHRLEEPYSDALRELEKACTMLKVLGSYPRAR